MIWESTRKVSRPYRVSENHQDGDAESDLSVPVYAELWKTGLFDRMNIKTDEDEHSIEMHLPYTAKAMER